MDSWDAVDGEELGEAPGLPPHQLIFDELLDKYNDGMEPLENWTTHDLVRLSSVVDAELQVRTPPYSEPAIYFLGDDAAEEQQE